jgi:hypothetical protein
MPLQWRWLSWAVYCRRTLCISELCRSDVLVLLLLLLLQEQENAAAVALAELGSVLQAQQLLAPLQLQLQGLSHFRNQVGRSICTVHECHIHATSPCGDIVIFHARTAFSAIYKASGQLCCISSSIVFVWLRAAGAKLLASKADVRWEIDQQSLSPVPLSTLLLTAGVVLGCCARCGT